MDKTVYSAGHERLVSALTQARKDAGLKQSELAARVGRDQSFISTIETGQRRVDVMEFHAIARALGLDSVDLFASIIKQLPDEESLNSEAVPDPLPDTAPELYENRADRSENPIDFLHRVYGPWLPGLYLHELRQRDKKLIDSIKAYCQRQKIDVKTILPPTRFARLRPSADT